MLSFIYLRNREYIFENGHISTKIPDLSTKLYDLSIFRQRLSIKKSYFLNEKQRNCQKIYQKILKRIVKLC